MSEVILRFSELKDVRELSKRIRKQDQQEAIALGYQPHKALYYSYKHGLYRITALVDDQVAAMWGVGGAPMGLVGQPYLVTSNLIYKLDSVREFIKIYKNEVNEMLKLFPVLENFVDASYEGAVRMLRIAGFTLSKPFKHGDYMFRKFTKVSN